MKFHDGFISNSSSTSFVICKDYLSKEMIDKIKENSKDEDDYYFWNLTEESNYLCGRTVGFPDVFDTALKGVGIAPEKVCLLEHN